MENQLPLHVSQLQLSKTIINRVHTLVHSTALLALLYYRFSSLPHIHGFAPFFSWLLISLCELLHSFLWVLGQACRWRPISRTVYPERLPADEHLPSIDVFICTADPKSEPTQTVMNTVISAMCLDYPPEKLFVYLSDDGGAPITLYGMKEAYRFAKKWVPFCRKYGLKTRAPDAYFSQEEEEDGKGSEFMEKQREMKLCYEEFCQHVVERSCDDEAFSSSPDRPSHVEVIQEHLHNDKEENGNNIPLLVYVSREKRRSYPHNFKAGALNVLLRVSGILSNSPYILFLDCDMYCNDPTSARQAMCFHMDPHISSSLAFVQFPQKFHNVSKNDIYNDLLRSVFEVHMVGVDGLTGACLCGTCFYMKRKALFTSPGIKDISSIANKYYLGCSDVLIRSLYGDDKSSPIKSNEDASQLLEEAGLVTSCTYEKGTKWGRQVGFVYYSVVEDYTTSFILHCKGWASVYCHPANAAFLGSVTTNLNDTLIQTTRWTSGLLQVCFSRLCPLIYGPLRMSILQSMVYASFAFMGLSAFPMLCYAILPQLCVVNGIPVYPKVSSPWFIIFAIIHTSWNFQRVYEMVSTGGSIKLWWNHQRIFIIKSVTSYFIGCLDIIMKLIGRKDINFVPTSKVVVDEVVERYKKDIFDFQASKGLLLPLTTIVSLNVASFLLGLGRAIIQRTYDDMFGQIYLSLFIVITSYPIIEGMMIRKDSGCVPTFVTLTSVSFLFPILLYIYQ